jgi:hypothetical protein
VIYCLDKNLRVAVFRVSKRDAASGTGTTQFGRALHEMNIDIICANTPSAKGRVERSFGTLQDRLVKQLRLAGISDQKAANAFLASSIDHYNAKFAKPAFSSSGAHRPIAAEVSLGDVFAWKEERTLSGNLTLQYDQMLFMLDPTPEARRLARQRVTVIDYPDGRLAVRHQGRDLPNRVSDKLQKVDQAAIVENKRLGAVLSYIATRQQESEESRSQHAPRRQGQAATHMFRPS